MSDAGRRDVSQVAETCRKHGAADVEVYPTDLTDHAAVDSLAKQLLDKHKVCLMALYTGQQRPATSFGMPRRVRHVLFVYIWVTTSEFARGR